MKKILVSGCANCPYLTNTTKSEDLETVLEYENRRVKKAINFKPKYIILKLYSTIIKAEAFDGKNYLHNTGKVVNDSSKDINDVLKPFLGGFLLNIESPEIEETNIRYLNSLSPLSWLYQHGCEIEMKHYNVSEIKIIFPA